MTWITIARYIALAVAIYGTIHCTEAVRNGWAIARSLSIVTAVAWAVFVALCSWTQD